VERRLTATAAATLIALVALAPAVASGAATPRITGLAYFVRDDGSLPHVRLLVDVERADSVRVATVFHGKHAAAPTGLDDRISGHPWVLQHEQRGGKVYELIRRSLDRRGAASIRIRARNGAGTDSVEPKIRESGCTKDPPFYPLDCTIHR